MTNLTEQWKKGELPEETECYVRVNGDIYLGSIQYKNGRHNKKLPYVKSFNGQFITKYVEEVLAYVPSYEEWQASEKYNKHLEEKIKIYERKDKQATETSIAYNELAEENEELKHLVAELKEKIVKMKDVVLDTETNNMKSIIEIVNTAKENAELKELLKECRNAMNDDEYWVQCDLIKQIDELLGEE